jgi:hypothetical protein
MALQIQTLMGNDQGENLVPKLLVALEIPSRRRSVFVEDLDGVAVAIAKQETVGVDLISFGGSVTATGCESWRSGVG